MPKKTAAVDYAKCDPQACDSGVCLAALECEYGHLVQYEHYEEPEVNPAKWCHGCAKCVQACPRQAIKLM